MPHKSDQELLEIMRRGPEPFSVWRHAKTSHLYLVLHAAVNEADLEPVVVYRRAFGGPDTVWVRPASEFLDGRFVRCDGGIVLP